MVTKRSEYQNQFKSSVVRKHHDIYVANLALRHERRDREFMHTPLCWTELSPGGDAACSDSSEEEVCVASKTTSATDQQEKEVYQSLAEIMDEAKEKADTFRKQRLLERSTKTIVPRVEKVIEEKDVEDDDVNKTVDEKEVADKSLSIYDIVDKENRKLNQKIAEAYVLKKGKQIKSVSDDEEGDMGKVEEPSDLKDKESNLRKTFVKKRASKKSSATRAQKTKGSPQGKSKKFQASAQPRPVSSSGVPSLSLTSLASKRPVRPDRQGRVSSSKSRPASACPAQSRGRPPFLSYGAADVEDSLALHRTHNVLAQTDVYPLALRAKIRRDEEQRRHREKMQAVQHHASAEDLLERLSSVGLTPRDTWASEYNLQFHGYEPREYQRAVSARSVIPRAASTAFMPVRSGGCKVVHVD